MPKEWLSLSEVADLLGVHPSTVRNWANRGQIPVHRTSGGHRRFKRSEIMLWQQARDRDHSDPDDLIHNALKYIRLQMQHSALEAEDWYQKLDSEARARYGHSGRALLQGLRAYLSSDGEAAVAEARALGFEYAALGHRYHLSHREAVSACLFFRTALLDSFFRLYEQSVVQSPRAWAAMLRKVITFTDQILLTLVEHYEKY